MGGTQGSDEREGEGRWQECSGNPVQPKRRPDNSFAEVGPERALHGRERRLVNLQARRGQSLSVNKGSRVGR